MAEIAGCIEMLKTKYSAPSPSKRLVERRAFDEKMKESLEHKLTVIAAPAGYGKTSAVLKWLKGIPQPRAWLSIDPGDNDPLLFWRYLCAALDAIAPVSRDMEYVFASGELFAANMHLNILIDKLSGVPSDFLLILDDFHLITNHAILDVLAAMVKYLPNNMHVLLLSRTEPVMHTAALALQEDLVRIGVDELRFNQAEIARYCEARGYFLNAEEIQRIETYTEGWAAALVAVTLSLKNESSRREVIESFGPNRAYIESYLSEDVFNKWTKEQQDFMEKTSILNRLCKPLCEAVTGLRGGDPLGELYRQNSFLVRLDDEGRWFRYHHLFSEFLKKRLACKGEAAVRALHRRAAAWLEANDLCDEAFEHYFIGECYEEALRLIEAHTAEFIRHGEYSKAMAWINKLPERYTRDSLRANVLSATYLSRMGDFHKAAAVLARIEHALSEGGGQADTTALKDYWLAKFNLYILWEDFDGALSALARIASLPDIEFNYFTDLNHYHVSVYRCPYRVFVRMLRDRPDAYEALFNCYRSRATFHMGYYQLIKGEALYENGKLNEAVPDLTAAAGEAVEGKCPGGLVPATLTLAKIRRAWGDMAGALELVAECEKRLAPLHQPYWAYTLWAFRVRLYIDAGDVEKIDQWASEGRLSMFQDITAAREYELSIWARVLIFRRRYQDARMLLNRLLGFAHGQKRLHSAAEFSILLAIAAWDDLDEDAALKHLEDALGLGLREGYVSSFADELGPMVSLLELYLKRRPAADEPARFAAELLAYMKSDPRRLSFAAESGALEGRLTSSERRVLKCIKNAYTNQQIAAELGITLRTVKAHTGSIYKKLGVKNRVQCIHLLK